MTCRTVLGHGTDVCIKGVLIMESSSKWTSQVEHCSWTTQQCSNGLNMEFLLQFFIIFFCTKNLFHRGLRNTGGLRYTYCTAKIWIVTCWHIKLWHPMLLFSNLLKRNRQEICLLGRLTSVSLRSHVLKFWFEVFRKTLLVRFLSCPSEIYFG